jgi:hypothetical protein
MQDTGSLIQCVILRYPMYAVPLYLSDAHCLLKNTYYYTYYYTYCYVIQDPRTRPLTLHSNYLKVSIESVSDNVPSLLSLKTRVQLPSQSVLKNTV